MCMYYNNALIPFVSHTKNLIITATFFALRKFNNPRSLFHLKIIIIYLLLFYINLSKQTKQHINVKTKQNAHQQQIWKRIGEKSNREKEVAKK